RGLMYHRRRCFTPRAWIASQRLPKAARGAGRHSIPNASSQFVGRMEDGLTARCWNHGQVVRFHWLKARQTEWSEICWSCCFLSTSFILIRPHPSSSHPSSLQHPPSSLTVRCIPGCIPRTRPLGQRSRSTPRGRPARSAIPSDAGEKLFSASTADPAQEG
ncbi:hypothetical protein E4U38_006028, partial [Claviceps purpurea]